MMNDKKCQGCGITLQTQNPTAPGYVKNLEKDYCIRCFQLTHYGKYQKSNKTNQDYQKIISQIQKNSLVLYICDIFSLNLEPISKLNNTLLVLTKRDVLPKSIKDEKITEYIQKRYPNLIDMEIISSIHNYNLDNLLAKIKKYHHNQKIYLVGYTNSGKSTLLNKIIKNYSAKTTEITTSMYPETTLDKIEVKLDKNLTLIDTPGLIKEKNFLNQLPSSSLKKFHIKKEIKPRTIQVQETGSILIDDIIRLDYQTNQPNSITIYINNGVIVKKISPKNPSLKAKQKYSFQLEEGKDIVIEDICFIKLVHPINIDIYTNSEIDIKERDNLI